MTFGFPAFHTVSPVPERFADVDRNTMVGVLQNQAWTIDDSEARGLKASVPTNLFSWGESVLLEFDDRGRWTSVTSRCDFPLQCVDWGKNHKNICDIFLWLDLLRLD